MFKQNLIGYEDSYLLRFQRPKNLDLHFKKIDDINNRKDKFRQFSINFDNKKRESSSRKKKKSLIYDPIRDYNKDLDNFLLAKKIINISNRNIIKSSFSHLDINSPFLEMKKNIKKNLDRFKEKQISFENFNMFKRLSSQHSLLVPKVILNTNDSHNKNKVLSRGHSAKNSITNNTNDSDEYYTNKKSYRKSNKKRSIVSLVSDIENTNSSRQNSRQNSPQNNHHVILPIIRKKVVFSPKGRDTYNDAKKLDYKIMYSNRKQNTGDEYYKQIDTYQTSKNYVKKRNKSEVNYIKFEDGVLIN